MGNENQLQKPLPCPGFYTGFILVFILFFFPKQLSLGIYPIHQVDIVSKTTYCVDVDVFLVYSHSVILFLLWTRLTNTHNV